MAVFSTYNDRLPDPTFGVNAAGVVDNVTGTRGPGFASVSVSNNRPVQSLRTISGRGIQMESGSQHWEITINYHPMTRNDFDVVNSFLEARNGKLNPFYVVLPQHSKPKNAAFASFVLGNTLTVANTHSAGSSTLLINLGNNTTAAPSPGDYFNISDPGNANHKKAYKVTRVETNTTYQSGSVQPTASQVRVHTMPPLTRQVSGGSTVIFNNPRFRVIQKSDVLEYNLNTDNLYQFQLQLEEISA